MSQLERIARASGVLPVGILLAVGFIHQSVARHVVQVLPFLAAAA